MPKPLYIICSQSSCEDKFTGLYSIFNIIDKLRFSSAPIPNVAPIVEIRITSAWAKEPGDEDQTFEYQVSLTFPDGINLQIGSGQFAFVSQNYRITALLLGGLPWVPSGDSGAMVADARVRRLGDSEWSSQTYPIMLEIAQVANPQTENPAAALS
jgi:hypothetical protein